MNKIFAIIITIVLSLPMQVWAVDDKPTANSLTSVESVLEKEILEQNIDSNEFKQPISKRKIAKKFLAAMGGVAISSFAIFFILTIYNRIREGYQNQVKIPEGEVSLETPDDLNSAIRNFLDKTKW